jgi:hypothetical protein
MIRPDGAPILDAAVGRRQSIFGGLPRFDADLARRAGGRTPGLEAGRPFSTFGLRHKRLSLWKLGTATAIFASCGLFDGAGLFLEKRL